VSISRAELRGLVADTVAVWGGAGLVSWEGDALRVAAADGRAACIVAEGPLRWLLTVEGRRARPCASVVALLAALRDAVGPERAPALRMVAPSDG